MIQAAQSRWAHALFRPYLRYIMRRTFHSIRLINELPAYDASRSLCICSTHISWWDGFIFYTLNRSVLPGSMYCMMLERELHKYRFFSRLGAYSIEPGNRESVVETTRYTQQLLSDHANKVLVFPQGGIKQQSEKPITVKKGIQYFTRDTCAQVLPVALRIEWYNRRKPVVLISFGPVLESDAVGRDISLLEKAMQCAVTAADENIINERFVKEIRL